MSKKFACGCPELWEEHGFSMPCTDCGTWCCQQCGVGDEGSPEEMWTDAYYWCSQCENRHMRQYFGYSY